MQAFSAKSGPKYPLTWFGRIYEVSGRKYLAITPLWFLGLFAYMATFLYNAVSAVAFYSGSGMWTATLVMVALLFDVTIEQRTYRLIPNALRRVLSVVLCGATYWFLHKHRHWTMAYAALLVAPSTFNIGYGAYRALRKRKSAQ